ncbi:Zinc finger, RING-type [Sesbania bispinosa]|nr:Zinc finger, RING-type [Sesbania bispinosa]
MKFGYAFKEYLQEELLDENCAHIEYIRLKNVLKSCQNYCKDTSSDKDQSCQCQSCPLCDQKFFSELMKEASDISGYFSSRVKHLLHLHVATGLQRYVLRLRRCFRNDRQSLAQEGRNLIEYIAMNAIAIRKILKKYDKNFKSRMQAEHIELLHSPWLIELGAFYLNSSGLEGCELDGVYGHISCDLNITEAVMTLILPDSIKLEYDLTCAICLDFVFNPYALSCGHIFCKSCACCAASVMIFDGLKAASPESKCPICREVGVYSKAVHMLELDLLMKRRCKDHWKERLARERADTLKQTKDFWNLRSTYSIGLL